MKTNRDRISTADAIIGFAIDNNYIDDNLADEIVIDIIANLLHYIHAKNLTYSVQDVLRIANDHFNIELVKG